MGLAGAVWLMGSFSPKPYPSDLTNAQWELIAPMVAVGLGGRPPIRSRRRIVDAILYVNRTGCSWRQLPHDFPPVGHGVLVLQDLE